MDLTNQYCYFFDDDVFNETDRAGFRRRIINGENLQLCFWRIAGGATGSFLHHHVDQEQFGIIVRGKLDFRIGESDDQSRVVLGARRDLPGSEIRLARRQRLHRRRRARRGVDPRRVLATERTCEMGDSEIADETSGPDWRLAVDIGGTFTDVVLIDAATGRVDRRQDAHHAGGSARRRAHRRAPAAGEGRRAAGRDHGTDRPRHDPHHERADRRQDRSRRQSSRPSGFGDTHADPRRAPLRHVRPADRVPEPARAARACGRDRRANQPGRRRRRVAVRCRARSHHRQPCATPRWSPSACA